MAKCKSFQSYSTIKMIIRVKLPQNWNFQKLTNNPAQTTQTDSTSDFCFQLGDTRQGVESLPSVQNSGLLEMQHPKF